MEYHPPISPITLNKLLSYSSNMIMANTIRNLKLSGTLYLYLCFSSKTLDLEILLYTIYYIIDFDASFSCSGKMTGMLGVLVTL